MAQENPSEARREPIMSAFKNVDLLGDVDSSERAWPLHGLIRAIVTPWEMISR